MMNFLRNLFNGFGAILFVLGIIILFFGAYLFIPYVVICIIGLLIYRPSNVGEAVGSLGSFFGKAILILAVLVICGIIAFVLLAFGMEFMRAATPTPGNGGSKTTFAMIMGLIFIGAVVFFVWQIIRFVLLTGGDFLKTFIDALKGK